MGVSNARCRRNAVSLMHGHLFRRRPSEIYFSSPPRLLMVGQSPQSARHQICDVAMHTGAPHFHAHHLPLGERTNNFLNEAGEAPLPSMDSSIC